MPPRKKQRIDGSVLPVSVVPRRITRASTKAALADGSVAEDSPVIAKTKAKVKSAGQGTSTRIVGKRGLRTLLDLALDVQFEASDTVLWDWGQPLTHNLPVRSTTISMWWTYTILRGLARRSEPVSWTRRSRISCGYQHGRIRSTSPSGPFSCRTNIRSSISYFLRIVTYA